MPTRRRLFIAFFVVILLGALAHSQGFFEGAVRYVEIPHGSHSHYIPADCPEGVDAGLFPSAPPEEGEPFSCAQFGQPTID